MTPRLYANPFVREAKPAFIVERTPWRYVGIVRTTQGLYETFVRTVVYSDGTRLSDDKLVDARLLYEDGPRMECSAAWRHGRGMVS